MKLYFWAIWLNGNCVMRELVKLHIFTKLHLTDFFHRKNLSIQNIHM